MKNGLNLLLGFLSLGVGVYFFIRTTQDRMKGDKGGYGAQIQAYFASIMFILIGVVMIVRVIL